MSDPLVLEARYSLRSCPLCTIEVTLEVLRCDAFFQIWTLDEPAPWLRLIESHDIAPSYAALDISRLWRREPV